jgi:hypothetical protein
MPSTRRVSRALFALAILAAFGAPAGAASVYVVHGIPGQDLGLPAELPVDISVDGSCALDAVEFGAVLGPVELPTGTHDIEIRVSDGVDGTCTGLLAVTGSIDLAVAESAAVVAHLDQNGAARITRFTNKVRDGAGSSRLAVIHAAAAPAVDVKAAGAGAKLRLRDVANGDQSFAADVPAGTYAVKIAAADGGGTVFGPADVTLEKDVAYTAFAVGSVDNETFSVLLLAIPLAE